MKLLINHKQFLYILFFFFLPFNAFSASNLNIIIEGNPSIDEEIIYSIIDDIDFDKENDYDKIIEALYKTGNFKDVSIEIVGNDLKIKFLEYLKINNLSFVGNKRFKKTEILEIFDNSKYFTFYNDNTIQKFIEEFKSLYSSFGYNQANISIELSNKSDDSLDLTFIINEGKISKINKVNFVGNNTFSKNILIDQIKSKPRNSFIFFTKRNYKSFEAKNDSNNLVYFYRKNGFKDVSIDFKSEFISNKNKFNLYYYIDEGLRFSFNEIKINFDLDIINAIQKDSLNQILDDFIEKNISKNIYFNIGYLEKISDLLTDYLFSQGFNFFNIIIKEKTNLDTVDIVFDIKSSKPRYVKNINIYGNSRTLDRIIRREISFAEGDAITDYLIGNTDKRLKKLNLFGKVDIVEKKINDEYVDIDINLTEKSTGEFNVGLSVGTFDGATFVTRLKERNMYGTGRNLDLEVNTSSTNTVYKAKMTEPFFMNKDMSLSTSFGYSEKDYSSSAAYNLNIFEISAGIGYYIIDDLFHQISLKYDLKDYTVTNQSLASSTIKASQGSNASFYLENKLISNNLNSFIRPTDGRYISYNNTLSPSTNSNNGLIKNIIEYRRYSNLSDEKYILSLQTRLANVSSLQNNDINNDEKFSLGGNWLRGFDSFGVGPRNSRTSYIGGNNLFVTKLDFKKPFIQNTDNPIDLNLFTDFGTVYGNKTNPTYYSDSFRASYGFGFNFYSPIGPIGFTWGFPLADESYDIKRMFFFSIGNLN